MEGEGIVNLDLFCYLCRAMGNIEWKGKSIEELKKLLQHKMEEVYRLRQEISRMEGDVPGGVDVDYSKYLTE